MQIIRKMEINEVFATRENRTYINYSQADEII